MDINDAGKFEIKSTRKKISFLIAECFQNIVRHADPQSKDAIGFNVPELFMLRNNKNIHHLTTGNIVKNNDRIKLTESIEQLQSLSKDELKELYLNVFANCGPTEKGGAGLGLIEMARKSGSAPSYKFEPLGNNYSNFFFQVNVIPQDYTGVLTPQNASPDYAMHVYDVMAKNKVVLLQKGDFSKESISPLISLFENNLKLKAENIDLIKRVVTLLIEMLENVRDHAKELNGLKEGIFYVRELSEGQYEINTGNFLPVSQAILLKERLEILTRSKNNSAAETQLKDAIKYEEGQGLIEISNTSSGKMTFDFKPIGHSLAFFSFKVNI